MPKFPYISGQKAIVQTFAQLRKGLPPKVDASYLQRFNIARANESYVIAILRYLNLIGEDGVPLESNTSFFYGDDDTFKAGLESALQSAYKQLFDEMGDSAFREDRSQLAHWFRSADKTSDLVGQRQASTFLTLAALAGHGDVPEVRTTAPRSTPAATSNGNSKTTSKRNRTPKPTTSEQPPPPPGSGDGGTDAQTNLGGKTDNGVGLTVRVEVNLPPGGDAETYDAIFASIKKHLMS